MMRPISVLDEATIDKIAAGEVVERPASIVKELVENAIDAGANSITVEIKDGGISLIRITDNGTGIEKNQIKTAFLRHATSKIASAEDLPHVASLGFRGEALSSISAVSRVELITKTKDSLTGSRFLLEGGKEIAFEEIGAPEGTTFIIRDIFFNTPVRRKFLKTAATEGSYIVELMEHMALSRPDIAFKFVVGNQVKFYTSGNGKLKEVIYRIFGKDTAENILPFSFSKEGVSVDGFLGSPSMVRSNRNYEIYYINGRFIKSTLLSKAIEDGYREYLMQHKFPFCVLHIAIEDKAKVDVNVHPTKMEVRFTDGPFLYNLLADEIANKLSGKEMIPEATLPEPKKIAVPEAAKEVPQVMQAEATQEMPKVAAPVIMPEVKTQKTPVIYDKPTKVPEPFEIRRSQEFKVEEAPKYAAVQETLFDQSEPLLSQKKKADYRFIGQVFDTYWMIQYEDKLLIVDQHAAHEKVKYERLMHSYRQKAVSSQNLLPPLVVTLNGREENVYKEYAYYFENMGFEIEHFGGNEYTMRAVPVDLYGCDAKEMFLEVLDQLSGTGARGDVHVIEDRIATMSCKAAVKGNNRLSEAEAKQLIDELLTLDNPYNCPHGRPTVITLSKYEMEKKFKR